jgi:two-component system heavy metal sensor histidine kinase CusS
VGFGLYFLSVINKAGMDRIDQEILALGGSQLYAPPRPVVWRNFGQSLHYIYDERRLKDLIVRVTAPGKGIFFESADWPQEISEASFPEFDHEMAPFPNLDASQGGDHASSDARIFPGHEAGLRPGRNDRPDNSRTRIPPRFNYPDEQRRQSLLLQDDLSLESRFSPPLADGPFFRPIVQIKKTCFRTIKTPTGSWRVAITGNQWVTVIVGMNMAGFFRDAEHFKNAFLIALPLALLFLAAGGWVIADRAMKPVAMITRTAEGITAQALDQRIPVTDSGTELSRLVQVINNMLERLQKSFSQAVRFSADAAHELQTPLTVLQGELDDAVQHAPLGSEEQRRYSGLLEEVQRLKTIVQKLLILARADAGRLNLRLELVDLSGMIESACEDAGVIAPHLRIEKEIMPGAIVKADPDLLRQVIQNLTTNAVKYNIEKGLVRFRLKLRDETVHVTISNTGNPIPVKDGERIFDRFYRLDKSHSRTIPGAGLGLSLAREIMHAHHGNLSIDPGQDNLVSFTLSMPCIPLGLISS